MHRFKLDENLPRDAQLWLRAAGHDVDTVLNEQLGGATDSAVFQACEAEGRILVTLDLDFADIRQYPPESHSGIWVLRPARQSAAVITALLKAAAKLLDSEPTVGRLWIIDAERVRIRA